ncbi:MAG TPA: hypothetical protein VEL76_19355 [Gemmataceae bacterium]|nr:hypothetical protein [Gemmataceae bacterium]
MNGFITRAFVAGCVGAALTVLGGCRLYDRLVDPCWPERYNSQARESVEEAFGTQVFNGHILDQTVWADFFEPATDKLTLGGQTYLTHLARVRPHPDPKVYLQTATANDVVYDPAAPEKGVNARRELNQKRVEALYKFLNYATADRPVAWQVDIHDPTEKSLSAVQMDISIRRHQLNAQGLLPPQGTGPGMAPGGPTGPSPR